jgi:hypothetical protein
MQLNQIRIGNVFQHNEQSNYANHKGLFRWSEDDWYALGHGTLSIENVSPVELNETRLKMLGFEELGNEHHDGTILDYEEVPVIWVLSNSPHYFGRYQSGDFHLVTINHPDPDALQWNFTIASTDIRFVHLIQNLYFAIYQKEFPIKM